MEQIIVTVYYRRENKEVDVDMEVPCDVPSGKLASHIAQVLNQYKHTHYPIESGKLSLYSPRQKRTIGAAETFHQAGIWNGDYIYLK